MIEFRYPLLFFLYGLLLLGGLHRWIVRKRRAREAATWGDEELQDRLFGRINHNANRWKRRIRWWGLALLIFASTGPQIGTKLTEVKRKGVDILVAVDVSSSMKAEDVKPNRLEKAKFEISRLISGLKGDRIGLIVFAGTSHLYLPLTGDYDAAKLFLDAVDTDMMRTQGTALGEALKTAILSFPEREAKHKVLIVVTDGEDHEGHAVQVAREAAKTGIVVHTIGVGTTIGSLIPLFDEKGDRLDYKKDRKGKVITTTLNASMLRELADAGGGVFVRFDNRSGSIDELLKLIHGMEKRTLKTHEYTQFEDRYGMFAAFGLLLLAGEIFISNRRRDHRVWRGRFV